MQAAVLHTASETPRAESFADPDLQGQELSARVLAAGLHQLVRVHANGTHYTSPKRYPLVPGIDGVAELPDGRRVYFSWPRAPYGTFAERVALDPARAIELPAGLDPVIAAAIVNPASASWFALRLRTALEAGEHVLVLGATGASGQLAVQNARALGAGRVIACGRNARVLAGLGADAALRIDAVDFAAQLEAEVAAHGVDVVLDFLWGPPASAAMHALLSARTSSAMAARTVRYVNIGQSAAGTLELSPHILRSMKFELLGSGLGSVTPPEMAREIPGLLAEAARGAITIAVEPIALSEIERAWTVPAKDGRRVVIVPSP